MGKSARSKTIVVSIGGSGTQSLIAAEPIDSGELIARFEAQAELPRPARHSVQTGISAHILLRPEYLQYVNHGCDPNIVFDTRSMEMRSIRPISSGSEIRYFYPSTEWEMASPFSCDCGSPKCLREIRGASQLSAEELGGYYLADHIVQLLAMRELVEAGR